MLAAVLPAGGRKRRCSLAQLEVARDSQSSNWPGKKGVSPATGLSPGCLCVQAETPECRWGWDLYGAMVAGPGLGAHGTFLWF